MRGWTIGAACLWMATCAAAVDRPGTIWRPASTANYSDRNWDTRAVVDTIVIHTGEGSYGGIISWFQNPSASASSQYVIARNGEITQMVADNDMSWHSTYYNSHSIGIETEGFAGDPNQWTAELLGSLADLCAWLCEAYAIQPTHPAGDANTNGGYYNGVGLVGHYQVQTSGSTAARQYGVRTDPGVYFPWDAFVQMVQLRLNGAAPAPTNLRANAYASGGSASVDFSWDASAGAEGYYVDVAQSESDLVNMRGTFQNWDVGTDTAVTWNGLAPRTTYFWRVWAYNGAGGDHGYPDGPFTTPGANRLLLGLGRGGNGRAESLTGAWAHEAWLSQGWTAYNAANGAMTPACGDLDGDGVDEIVCGLGAYTSAGGWVAIFEGGTYAFSRWIRLDWSAYNAANGETRPAVGDFDGDGRAEIALGIATHTASGGWVYLYDDASADYRFLRTLRLPWSAYNAANGSTRPAAGDIDGDGRDELVVGLGSYPGQGGWSAVFEDATGGYALRQWVRIDWSAYNTANGEVRPACGNLDGDAAEEIVLGIGRHTAAGGYARVVDDAGAAYAKLGWARAAWAAYNSANGEVRPAVGDVDGDGRGEVVLGLGTYATAGGYAYVAGDASRAYGLVRWVRVANPAYNAANGETWPAIGRIR